jgi:hypothetical protein
MRLFVAVLSISFIIASTNSPGNTFLLTLAVTDSKTSPISMELESYLPFFTAFTVTRNIVAFETNGIESTLSHHTSLISILILSSCLGLGIFRDFLIKFYALFPHHHWCYTFYTVM